MNRLVGFAIGGAVLLVLSLLALVLVPWPYSVGGILVVVGYFGIGGLIQVPIAHKGVPLLFGGRLRWALNEGWNWLLPRPLMSAEAIDVRERSSVVEKFTVVSGGGVSGVPRARVRVTFDSTIQWKISNPYQSLSVGEEVIERGLKDLIRQVLRSQVVNLTDEQALEAHEQLRNVLEETADRKAVDWGIDITNVLIGSIALEEEVMKDYERLRREERQRDAERIELEHVRDRIREVVAIGFTPERAQEIVQTERGKVKKEVREQQISIPGETRGALEGILRSIFGR